jgi:hypothetical protein
VLEMGEDEGGAGDVADLAGADGDVLEGVSRRAQRGGPDRKGTAAASGNVIRAAYVQGGDHARRRRLPEGAGQGRLRAGRPGPSSAASQGRGTTAT